MKKFLLILFVMLIPKANADLLNENYVSPENYAVNEADLLDYRQIAPPPKLDLDALDDTRVVTPNVIEKDISIGEDKISNKKVKVKKSKKDKETYQEGLVYKIAKWWIDQRYKREEPHHGVKHEIKVQKRLENEKSLENPEI